MRILRGAGRFTYEFVVGDDWKIAAAVLVVLGVAGVLVVAGLGDSVLLAPVGALALIVTFAIAVVVDARPR